MENINEFWAMTTETLENVVAFLSKEAAYDYELTKSSIETCNKARQSRNEAYCQMMKSDGYTFPEKERIHEWMNEPDRGSEAILEKHRKSSQELRNTTIVASAFAFVCAVCIVKPEAAQNIFQIVSSCRHLGISKRSEVA